MTVKINSLEIENLKRIKAVSLEPTLNGLTVIGGKNGQGKTSVLDSIAWALGGEKYRPSTAQRDGSCIPPNLHISLSNGIVVERKGKNSDLKVTDPAGKKSGQQLLNSLIDQLALDLPRFMQSTAKEKAQTLLKIIGVDEQLNELETKESKLYNQRLAIGQIADQKIKFAREMVNYPNAPANLVSASELIRQHQEILARNGENEEKRRKVAVIQSEVASFTEKVDRLKSQLEETQKVLNEKVADLQTALKSAESLKDESTLELEQNIADVEAINIKVRANLDKSKAEDDAEEYQEKYGKLSIEIENVRQAKFNLLKGADLPLKGLSVDGGELTYKGYKWDNMSGSEQLRVATAIVRKLNPECGFVLLDKLEQMDTDTLKEFGEWLEQEGLQAIATRVSTGDECSIIIEDGYVSETKAQLNIPKWTEGEF